MLRRIIERLSRNVVLKRRLPATFGRRPFFVSPDSALGYLKPRFSGFDDLMSVAQRRLTPGKCVWDIGGNLGVFSFLAANVVGEEGTVVTVEPDPFLASLIQKSAMLKENSTSNIHVLCAAVADELGILRFMIAERGRSSNSLELTGSRSQAGGVRYTQFVPTTTLDDMLETFPAPDFVKIDVEGAEAIVLSGAEKLLRETRPQLYVEVGETSRIPVTEMLRKHDYTLFEGDISGSSEVRVLECVFNTLAVPSEQVSVENGCSGKMAA